MEERQEERKYRIPDKVLKYKTYETVGHLSKSRLGPTESHIAKSIEESFTKELPNQQSLVIVQEKYDGSNVSVVRHGGRLIALSRNGYPCLESQQEQHQMFHRWMIRRYSDFDRILRDEGDRITGEWMALAHGTKYEIKSSHDAFIAFDLFSRRYSQSGPLLSASSDERIPGRAGFLEFTFRVWPHFRIPRIIHLGGACSINRATNLMAKKSPGYDYEGFIYRIEENGVFKSIAKYVRHDKVDALYLIKEDDPGFELTWNWRER